MREETVGLLRKMREQMSALCESVSGDDADGAKRALGLLRSLCTDMTVAIHDEGAGR